MGCQSEKTMTPMQRTKARGKRRSKGDMYVRSHYRTPKNGRRVLVKGHTRQIYQHRRR